MLPLGLDTEGCFPSSAADQTSQKTFKSDFVGTRKLGMSKSAPCSANWEASSFVGFEAETQAWLPRYSGQLSCSDKVSFPLTIWGTRLISPQGSMDANLDRGFGKCNGAFFKLEKVKIGTFPVMTHGFLNDCLTAKCRPDLLSTVQNQSMMARNVRLNTFSLKLMTCHSRKKCLIKYEFKYLPFVFS